jgi:hypothetical protein
LQKFFLKKKKKKSLPVFAGIQRDFARITVDGSPESLLMAFWEKNNNSKVSELKEIETLRGSIEKIETLVAELEIAANFKG